VLRIHHAADYNSSSRAHNSNTEPSGLAPSNIDNITQMHHSSPASLDQFIQSNCIRVGSHGCLDKLSVRIREGQGLDEALDLLQDPFLVASMAHKHSIISVATYCWPGIMLFVNAQLLSTSSNL